MAIFKFKRNISTKMFSKGVLCTYAFIFLWLKICNSGTSAEGPIVIMPQSPNEKPGGGILWTFEDYARLVVMRVDKVLKTVPNVLDKGNAKMTSARTKLLSGVSKGPYTTVNTALTAGTFAFGRFTVVIASVLEVVNQNATGQKVIKFGSSVSQCYRNNTDNVLKTTLTSLSNCIGEETKAIVDVLDMDIAALQTFVMDLEMVLQEMQDCTGVSCNKDAAQAFAKRIQASWKSLLMSLLNTAKTGATLAPKGGKCLGSKTGMTTAKEVKDMVGGFAGCVSTKMKS